MSATSVGGDVEAIRDWANSYFYNNDQIAEMFIKAADPNLSAYKLTIIDTANKTIEITEDALTDPQSYSIKTDNYGFYIGLFFFHSGSTLTLNDGSGSAATHVLSSYEDTIALVSSVIATPVMTSNTTPSGTCRASSVYSQSGSSANWEPWHAFTQVADPNGWVPTNGYKVGEWIEYEFSSKVVVVKFEIINRDLAGAVNASPTKVKIQASNDGTNYTDLGECTITQVNVAGASEVLNLTNVNAYKIYRTLITGADSGQTYVAIGGINLYKPDA